MGIFQKREEETVGLLSIFEKGEGREFAAFEWIRSFAAF